MTTTQQTSSPPKLTSKGLAAGKLGLMQSTVIGLASTAPLYSLAATLGFIVMAAGAQTPAALIVAFIPMCLTAFAYRELNTAIPDSGTAFTWAAKAFGPKTGWMAGWAVMVAGVIVMSSQTEVASKYLLLLIGDGSIADSKVLVTAFGALIIISMTWISYRDVETGAITQYLLMALQYAAIIAFCIGLYFAIQTMPELGLQFSWDWFNPFATDNPAGFVQGVLIAIFIYWGWDTCLALAEETKNPRTTPGADDVFFALRLDAMGSWGWLLVLAVAVSALATCQTTILPTARGTLSMGVYGALPKRFGVVNQAFKTPAYSTLFTGSASLVFYVGMTIISGDILADTIESTSLAVALYYAITSFACIWYFRSTLTQSVRNLFFRLLMPLVGGLMMSAVFIYSAISMLDPEYGTTTILGISGTFVMGVGSLALGLVVMGLWALRPGSRDYFAGRSLNRDTPVLVPEH